MHIMWTHAADLAPSSYPHCQQYCQSPTATQLRHPPRMFPTLALSRAAPAAAHQQKPRLTAVHVHTHASNTRQQPRVSLQQQQQQLPQQEYTMQLQQQVQVQQQQVQLLQQQQPRGPQQFLDALLSGPCLVAAGALACSFISLQVKLFDQHVPPLQVTACSSAVAWLATSAILQYNQQQQRQQRPRHSRQQQQQQELGAPPPEANPAAAAAATALPLPATHAATAAVPAAAVPAQAAAVAPTTQSLLLLRGLLGAATVTAYYAAVEELPLPVATALFFFHPVLALLLDSAVNGTRVPRRAAASCALTVVGVLVIGWHDQLILHLQQAAVFVEVLAQEGWTGAAAAAAGAGQEVGSMLGPELSLYGVCMGLIAAAANAAAFVVVGLIGKDGVSPLRVCWWQYCVTTHAAVAVLLLSELETAVVQASSAAAVGAVRSATGAAGSFWGSLESMGGSSSIIGSSGSSGVVQQLQQQLQAGLPSHHDALLLGGVVVANFVGQLLLNAGFQRVDAGRGAAVNTLQVLFANAWDVLLLHSQPCGAIMAGSGLIAAGVVGTRQSAETAGAEGGTAAAAAAMSGSSSSTERQQ